MSEPDAPEADDDEKPVETEAPAAPAEAASDDAVPAKKKKKKPDAELPIDDPRVREIEAMFVAGDFARTREIANELLSSTDPRLVDVGRDYLHRTGVDPIQIAFLGLCAAVLIAIAWIYIPH